MTINERFKEIRLNLNKTQADFGEQCGLGRAVIANIENNRSPVTPLYIKVVVDNFGVNEEWLIKGTGDMFLETKERLSRGRSGRFCRRNDGSGMRYMHERGITDIESLIKTHLLSREQAVRHAENLARQPDTEEERKLCATINHREKRGTDKYKAIEAAAFVIVSAFLTLSMLKSLIGVSLESGYEPCKDCF